MAQGSSGGGSKLPFLDLVEDAEKNFLAGRRHRGDELESAVRFFLEFLRGFEKGKIMGQACDNCGKVYVPPRGACAKCGAPTSKEVECANKGTVVTMTVVRVPSENIQVELPYVAANVLLDGADITFTALIQECSSLNVSLG